jgi:hypothetical protein
MARLEADQTRRGMPHVSRQTIAQQHEQLRVRHRRIETGVDRQVQLPGDHRVRHTAWRRWTRGDGTHHQCAQRSKVVRRAWHGEQLQVHQRHVPIGHFSEPALRIVAGNQPCRHVSRRLRAGPNA